MSESGATPENASLTLGFFGDQEVHRTHMKSLLDDFVEGSFKKSHRNAVVRCVVCVDPFTSTMADLADWALTSGYHLGLIGHADAFENREVDQFVQQAEGLIFKLSNDSIVGRALTSTLSQFDENRLILVADPNEDDDAYDAVDAARGHGVPVRSLLQGLERVVMDIDDEDQEQPPIHLVEDDGEGEEDEGQVDMDDDEDDLIDRDEPPDLDELGVAADDGDLAAQEELKDLALAEGIDSAGYETWMDVVVAIREGDRAGVPRDEAESEAEVIPETATAVTDGYYPEAEETTVVIEEDQEVPEPVPEEEPDEEEEEEQPPVAPQTASKYTVKQLERMELDELVEAAAQVNKRYRLNSNLKAPDPKAAILPGRGMKAAVFRRRILEAQGDLPVRTAPVRTAKPKAKTTKKAATKKTATRRTTATKAPRRTAAVQPEPAHVNGVDREALRAFLKTAKAAIDIAEQLA